MLRKLIALIAIELSILNLGWSQATGTWNVTGTITMTGTRSSAQAAQLPINWVDSHMCDAPGGVYDVTRIVRDNTAFTILGPGTPGLKIFTEASGSVTATESGNTVTLLTSASSMMDINAGDVLGVSSFGVTGYNGTFTVGTIAHNTNGGANDTITYTNGTSGLGPSSGGTATGYLVMAVTVALNTTLFAGEPVTLAGASNASYNANYIVRLASGQTILLPATLGQIGLSTSGNGTLTATGGNYPGTFAGLLNAYTDWQVAANQWWLIKVDAGLNIHGSSYDSNKALVTFTPGKAGATKCIVFASSTPTTNASIVCSHGLPGYGGARNPGCANDLAKFWKMTADSAPVPGNRGIYIPGPLSNGAVGTNHVLIRDAEMTVLPGAFQSAAGVNVTLPAVYEGDHIGLINSYIHGWDPGDQGQPVGVCSGWNRSGTLSITNGANTATWVSGGRFGSDFADIGHSPGYTQAQINIGGTNYFISSHDPAVSDTVLTIATPFIGTTGTNAYTLTNPMTKYANGCGDDQRGIQVNCDNCWIMYNYIEKQHWWASEGHSIGTGMSVGPTKIAHNWVECPGGACVFYGGADLDTSGGPVADSELRGNVFIRDLDWRLLTGTSGKSPHPPFGCGPLDNSAAHDTCPMKWAIKNILEFKTGRRVLVDGNIFGGNWADGQAGYAILLNIRCCSGGETGGVYSAITGLPLTATDNITISNNWIWGSPQGIQFSTRSLNPGNGGGISQPMFGVNIINNVFSWMGDDTALGAPGPDMFQWAASGTSYKCTASRSAGIAHMVCAPPQVANLTGGYDFFVMDNAYDVSGVSSVGDVVTVKLNNIRHDPKVGGTFTIAGTTGWSGTFTISSATQAGTTTICTQDYANQNAAPNASSQPQPCIRADGTFADTIIYTDSINHPGTATLCTNTSTCGALNAGVGIRTTLDTLAYKITDISVGDGVSVPALGESGSPGCVGGVAPTEYQVGSAPPLVRAVAPTNPVGLDVYYPNASPLHDPDSSGTVCEVRNSAGWPAHVVYAFNTFITPDVMSIGSNGLNHGSLHYDNSFFANTFVTHDTGTQSDVTCSSPTGIATKEGSMGAPAINPMSCWDPLTLKFYNNVMVTRNTGNWASAVFPVGGLANFFPNTPSCSGAAPDGTCAGFQGFMNNTAFQTANCVFDGSNRMNCPQTPLPWSTNFNLSMLKPFNSSSVVFGRSADIPTVENAFTRTIYVCQLGVYCGPHGPYPD